MKSLIVDVLNISIETSTEKDTIVVQSQRIQIYYAVLVSTMMLNNGKMIAFQGIAP